MCFCVFTLVLTAVLLHSFYPARFSCLGVSTDIVIRDLLQEPQSHSISINKPVTRRTREAAGQPVGVISPVTCKSHHPSRDVWNTTVGNASGDYSLEIQFSRELGSRGRAASAHTPFNATIQDSLYIKIIAHSNATQLSLYVDSCMISTEEDSSVSITLLHQGCLNNRRVAEHPSGNGKEKVYSIKLSSLPKGTSQIFVTCDVQLCPDVCSSGPCLLGCALVSGTEAEQHSTQRVRAGPIHIRSKEDQFGEGGVRRVYRNYAAMTVGLVLGGAVLYVVLVLVKKSFAGLSHRSIIRSRARLTV
ncbi:uncharacterized protein LOC103174874 isoform X1 [Callorhinchus milii]|uniref:uncharacterized protein LOC103174874 isoform X1 n=1 Tax=Callorhinchus milii TaxID=7868 RepID=UPI001C3FC8DB|nr:uncharacterized protein LOC103174874 isoform X1 [Callorhinchus milii]